jgi:hypothetical protein
VRFCGLECYHVWEERQKAREKQES